MVRGIPLSNTNSENTRHIICNRRLNHTHNFAFPPTHSEEWLKGPGPISYAFLHSRATRYNSDFPSFLAVLDELGRFLGWLSSDAGRGG